MQLTQVKEVMQQSAVASELSGERCLPCDLYNLRMAAATQ